MSIVPMTNPAPLSPAVTPAPPAQDASAGKAFWLFVDLAASLFWVYVITKLFFVDIDVLIAQRLFPDEAWLLQFKFIFFLGVLALLFLPLGLGLGLLVVGYVLFFPIIIAVWKIPYFVFKRKNWTLAFAIINLVISFFQSLRYRLIVSTCWLVAFVVIFVSDDPYLLWLAGIVLIGCLFTSYAHRLMFVLKPFKPLRVYTKFFSGVRPAMAGKLDDDVRAVALADLNKTQLQQWKTKLELCVLFNRSCLFVARRLKDYQNSGVHILSAVLITMSLVILTILSFAAVNYAAYKSNPASFETTSSPSFFTFFYYSFNTFLFNSIKEVVPVSWASQSAGMVESVFALFLFALFVSLMLPFRRERYTIELGDTIAAIEAEGKSMEAFIKTEYLVDTVEEALIQLEKLQASMMRLLLMLSEGLK